MRKSRVRQVAIVFVGAAILVLSASTLLSRSRKSKSTEDIADKTNAVPEFSISVNLSEEAKKRLLSMHESILVIAYFDGDPLPGQGEDNAPFRDVYLGSDQKLVDSTNVATFDSTKISQSHWDRLSDKNYFVTINVVSARMASKNNLLDCGVPEDHISTFAGKATEVHCKLIGEGHATIEGRAKEMVGAPTGSR
ncbi:MAG: hypothetical protein ABSF16_17860 [Terracidiphilus sp.]